MSLKDKFKRSAGVPVFPKESKLIKPEHAAHGSWYAFTYNPAEQPPEHYRKTLFYDWFQEQVNIFHGLKGCTFRLYPEFSQKGRLHFHGILMIDDFPKFFMHDMPYWHVHGNIDIDTMDDMPTWLLYCMKNKEHYENYVTDMFPLRNGRTFIHSYPLTNFTN